MVSVADKDESAETVLGPEELQGLPHLYANGFQLGLTNADVNLVLKLNNRPVGVLNLSYTLSKTLHEKIGGLISRFEKASGRKMLVTEDVDAAFAGLAAKKKKTVAKPHPPVRVALPGQRSSDI